MNIRLLRAAQASILDPANAFDMGDWCYCIAGHIVKAAGSDTRNQLGSQGFMYGIGSRAGSRASQLARLRHEDASTLFYGYADADSRDRQRASAVIDRVIARRQRSGSALEPCAQRAAARAEAPEAPAEAEAPAEVEELELAHV